MEAPETQPETATLDDNPVSNGANGAAEVADAPDSAGLHEDDVPVREERVVVSCAVLLGELKLSFGSCRTWTIGRTGPLCR